MDATRKRKASDQCSFGDYIGDGCHNNKFAEGSVDFCSLTEEMQISYKWRAGILVSDTSLKTICHYHYHKFGDGFSKQNTKCCNVFNTHKKKVKGGHIVTLQLAMALKSNGLDATPGWQLCRSCFGKATAESDDEVK